jgi:aminopeptidase N
MRTVTYAIVILFLTCSLLHSQYAEDDSFVQRESQRAQLRLNAEAAARPMEVDAKYYALNIRVTNNPALISGSVLLNAVVAASSLDSLSLDLSFVHAVDSVVVEGVRSLRITRAGDAAYVLLPRTYSNGEPLTLKIFYHGTPPTGTGLGSFDTKTLSDGSLWYSSLSEPYGGRLWWPSIDHPSDKADSADIWITCDQTLTAVSNGLLVETRTNGDGTKTYKWRHRYPIATYLIAATIAKFDLFMSWYKYSSTDSLPIYNYVTINLPPGSSARTTAGLTPRMLQIFESIFGPYPFRNEKYGHVEFSWGGGMEHQTLTSLGTTAWNEKTIAHELAHQWFGDLITCRTWPDLWLNEGFAQYFDAVYLERAYANGKYRLDSAMSARASSARSAPGTVSVQDTSNVSNLFLYSRVYQKGSWVLHMLRKVMGDSIFFAAIRAYADDPRFRYGTASTADFKSVCETVSGRYLGWFFNEWVFGEKYPQYSYSWRTTFSGGQYQTSVRVTQTTGTSNPSYFLMPIDLRLTGVGLDTTVTVTNNSADQTFSITTVVAPGSVAFDPDGRILKSVQFVTDVEDGSSIPQIVRLEQNFPNPFNPQTVISYTVTGVGRQSSVVSVRIYDVLGREVAVLVNEVQVPGSYVATWDAANQPSGIYYCRLISGGRQETKKMLLTK